MISQILKMLGSKAPDFDAYGLLRATHSHNPTEYSHIESKFYCKFVFVGVKISRQQEVFLTEERPYPHLLLHRSAGPALPQPVDNL